MGLNLDRDFVEDFYRKNYFSLVDFAKMNGANGFSEDAVQDLELYLLTHGEDFQGNENHFKCLIDGFLKGEISEYQSKNNLLLEDYFNGEFEPSSEEPIW